MYERLKPLLFKLAPEQIHHLTITLLRLAGVVPPAAGLLRWFFRPSRPGPAVEAFGLRFSNPVGLAAGYDKDGLAWRGLATLGFGHLELGTVTPLPQPGNPQPRLFRLPEDRAVINRMGFNNLGGAFLAARLQGKRPRGGPVLGVNIGKNKVTPLEEAAQDYLKLARIFAPLADYLAVNISSPNTPGLRSLQESSALRPILSALAVERGVQTEKNGRRTPILVKLAPDLEPFDLEAALETIVDCGMDGVILGNTTLTRPGLTSALAAETGGLSGAPLAQLSQRRLEETVRFLDGRLPVVACGGIFTPDDLRARLDAGACLAQVYTGLIYQGPGLVKYLLDHLSP